VVGESRRRKARTAPSGGVLKMREAETYTIDTASPCLRPSVWCVIRWWIALQVRWSHRLDRLLAGELRIDGNRDFLDRIVPEYLQPGHMVYDIGGGRNPVVGAACKAKLGLKVVGVDIDAEELEAAPAALYDDAVCADISEFRGSRDADIVICQALLEHVRDTEAALKGIAGILKPGGRALLFVPSRNAVYARINRILPEGLKRRMLFAIFPEMHRDHGFPAHYDRCTPGWIERLAGKFGLVCEHRQLYFQSDYFRFCLPLHLLWRAWLILFRRVAGAEAAETFTLVLRKESEGVG
jgi:SAM-dependent methyltransferase